MDDAPTLPHVFANQVIRQFVDHLLGGDMIVTARDYMLMRLVFRKSGGNWYALVNGDIGQTLLLETVVTQWGKLPGRQREAEEDV